MRIRADVMMVVVAGLVALLGAWLLRDYLLDDAFIHLRYAHNFAALHRITYDGATPSQGDSSLGYLLLMAAASLAVPGPMLPKLMSLLAYAGLFALIAGCFLRAEGRRKLLAGAALLVVVSPFGQRWLTDGMETALVAIIAAAIAMTAADRRTPAWALALLGLVAVVLRVEFLFVLGLAAMGRMLRATGSANPLSRRYLREWLGWAAPVIGGLAGALVLLAVFGHLLPDTALAKRAINVPLSRVITPVLSAHLGASMAGLGLLLLWVASLAAALSRSEHRDHIATLAVNAGLPLLLLLLAIDAQQIQGIRYFVFVYAFLIAWNLCLTRGAAPQLRRWQIALAALAACIWFAADAALMARVVGGRAEMHRLFTRADLTPLHGQHGLAWDVGYIGYFGGGRIWDANGLVNGRALATLSMQQRLQHHLAQPIRYVFANGRQLDRLAGMRAARNWPCLFQVDGSNAAGHDRHWLLAEPALARQLIAANPQWPDAGCRARRMVSN